MIKIIKIFFYLYKKDDNKIGILFCFIIFTYNLNIIRINIDEIIFKLSYFKGLNAYKLQYENV